MARFAAPQATPQAAAPSFNDEQMEQFLKTARVIRTRSTSKGITGSLRATLSDGTYTHDAQIQNVEISKASFEGTRGTELNFRDSFKFNVAAYKLSRLLGLKMIPPSVERTHAGRGAAYTWWVDNVMMDEGDRLKKKAIAPDIDHWNRQMWVVRVFDQLIYNTDRNLGNLLITNDWNIWMIDHTRAFRLYTSLANPKNLDRCDRDFLEALKKLDESMLTTAMEGYLRKVEIKGLLGRRDRIVEYFQTAGEARIFTGLAR
jgi:hypothetical protein